MIDVVAGILIRENKILIARRSRHKKMGGKWEFPGGKIEKNESPEECLERELKEEFGVVTKTKEHFYTNSHKYAELDINLMAFFSELIEGEFKLTDHDAINWVKIEDLLNFDLAEADVPIAERLISNLFEKK